MVPATTHASIARIGPSPITLSAPLVALWLALLLSLTGCKAHPSDAPQQGSSAREAAAPRSLTADPNTDPCATRLHDISGALLLYYAVHHEMPPSLEDLRAIDPGTELNFTCPLSGQPYVYNRAGLMIPGQPWRILLYDATPAHAGQRWGAAITDSQNGAPLVAKVLIIPESWLAAREQQ